MAQPPRPNPALTSRRQLTSAEVAAEFGVSVKTVGNWVRRRRLTPVKIHGTRLFDAAEVEALRRAGAR